MTRYLPIIISLFLFPNSMECQNKEAWVDSTLQSLSLDEKIGQVFTIRAFSKDDPSHITDVKEQIRKYHVGGICFFQGSPAKQIELVNEYQRISDLPLMISMDAEWGLGMRFPKHAISFPRQLTIGAINDHQLIYLMGKEIGEQCKMTGVQVNFAPVLDVNNNAANPVIHTRSFGEDRFNVASKAYAYMKGLTDVDVMACAKHFPGHGDTDVDSHYDLPVIPHSKKRLDSIELFPFDILFKQGMPSVMVAHLQVPALEERPNRPTTVSSNVVTDLLRNEMNFDGLAFTDGMEMHGVTKHFEVGEADLEAFLAGNDMILLPQNIHAAVKKMKEAIDSGRITIDRLNQSVRRVLSSKYDLGLTSKPSILSKSKIHERLNSKNAQILKSKIYRKAVTLISNNQKILPLHDISDVQFASVALGSYEPTTFQKRLSSYAPFEHFNLPKEANESSYEQILNAVADFDIVFISTHDMSRYASREFGFNQKQLDFVESLSRRNKVVLTLFGTPYAAVKFSDIPTIVIGNEEDPLAQEAAAQALFGASDITGKLPVSVGTKFKAGHGISLPSLNRFGYSLPEAVGLNSDTLNRIEKLVEALIENEAAPGCQVLVAKDNQIVYHKAFGYHTYDKKIKVKLDDLYDMASVTKVLASTISIMNLVDQGKFDLNAPLRKYIPEEDTTNKANLIYEDMLAHVSGLPGWIPFYKNTLNEDESGKISRDYYRAVSSEEYNIQVTPNLFLRTDYQDSIWRRIFSCSMRDNNNYRYSDLSFYLINRTIDNLTGVEVDKFAEKNFYSPLGLRKTLFNPLKKFKREQITPSEYDKYWRNQEVRGTVHDMGAAMLGGVSGHAGLFSNSIEIATLMQMLLNKGYYGGRQYIEPKTIEYFTKRHWRSSRRGIGFDMKELDTSKQPNMSELASRSTFGHTGFTGTATYADPEHDIVYVFLSNRTFPSMNNNKLGKEEYRPRIQSIIYKAMMTE